MTDIQFPVPPEAGDSAAFKEANAIANGTLEEEAKRADHSRSELFKSTLMKAAVSLIWLIAFLFAAAVVILASHMLLPVPYRWLQESELSQLKALVTGLIVSGAAQSFGRKYFR